ncbi:MAG: hypothetical protein ABF289_16090, partial [Clostridiales bacterium]
DNYTIPKKINYPKPEQKIYVDDTIQLIANYPDPFLGKTKKQISSKKNNSVKKIQSKPLINQSDIPVKWPVIKFDGTIQSANKIQGLLKIDNEQYFISESEIYNNVYIKKIYSDSVIVVFHNQSKSIIK